MTKRNHSKMWFYFNCHFVKKKYIYINALLYTNARLSTWFLLHRKIVLKWPKAVSILGLQISARKSCPLSKIGGFLHMAGELPKMYPVLSECLVTLRFTICICVRTPAYRSPMCTFFVEKPCWIIGRVPHITKHTFEFVCVCGDQTKLWHPFTVCREWP